MVNLADSLEKNKLSTRSNNPYRRNAEKIKAYKLTIQFSLPIFFLNFILFVSPQLTKFELVQIYGPIYIALVNQPIFQIISVYTKYVLPGKDICYTEPREKLTGLNSLSM
eukprot:snap_masked-scaffold_3-processed-gene-10.20-mRNA-1 protein AED:1.00 eAED:1.00 QI:0/-1/0/0/-1/1/1/0/109